MNCNEKEIELFIKCPLLDIEIINNTFIISNLVFNWAILQSFYGKIIPLETIRKKFELFWTRDFRGDKESKIFFSGLRIGNRVSKIIFNLLTAYEVVKPVEKYIIPSYRLEGEYTLLKKKNKKDSPIYILQICEKKDDYDKYPNIISLIRWYHAFTATEYTNIQVLKVYLSEEAPLIIKDFNQKKIEIMMSSLAINCSVARYNSPGEHCNSCLSKLCLESINAK